MSASSRFERPPAFWWGCGSVLALVLVVYLPLALGPHIVGFVADDALYLLMADYFAAPAEASPMLHYVRSISHLPPLYPMLLAAFGAGSNNEALAFLLQFGLWLLAVMSWAWVSFRISSSYGIALTATVILVLLPGSILLNSEIRSEIPYLLLSALAIMAVSENKPGMKAGVTAGLLIGLAILTRGFGWVAFVALLITVLVHARLSFLPSLLALLVFPVVATALQLVGDGGYIDIFLSRVDTFSDLREVLSQNFSAILVALPQHFLSTRTKIGAPLVAVLLLPAVVVFVTRLCTMRFDAIYLLGYLSLALIWPFAEFQFRFLYPIIPLLVIYVLIGLRQSTALWLRLPLRPLFVATLVVVLLFVTVGALPMLVRYHEHGLTPQLANWRGSRYWLIAPERETARRDIELHSNILDLLYRTNQHVPAGECIHAHHPQAAMYYSRRPSWPRPQPGAEASLCRYHLVVSDGDAAEAYAKLIGEYDIVDLATLNDGIAGVLVRYRE